MEIKENCLKQDKVILASKNVVNLFIVYELDTWSRDLNAGFFFLKYCLFGAVKLTKNADPDQYSYSGYDIGFDSHSHFSIPNFEWGKNTFFFGVGNSLPVHVDNKKDTKVLGEDPMQGLYDTTITAESRYFISFTRSKTKFCLSPHYNRSHSFFIY